MCCTATKDAPNKRDDKVWQHVLALARERYHAVNDRHLQELLGRAHSIHVGRESQRQHLRAAGIAPKRKRRPRKYRARRERRVAFGMLLQIDASPHDWLEGRGPRLTLVGAKDDATGYSWCRTVEAETTWAYLGLLREMCLADGIPLALYSDRHTIFHSPREPTIIEQIANQQPLTQFGRAMQELGIHIIKAGSPQAKGRIERLWGVLQDRLVVELRLAGAMTIREANRVLDRFMRDYNLRFTVAAAQVEAVFRRAPRAHELDRVLCLKETRSVSNDHTISFAGLVLQLASAGKYVSLARQRVEVLQLRDGSVEVVYKEAVRARFTAQALARMIAHHSKAKGHS